MKKYSNKQESLRMQGRNLKRIRTDLGLTQKETAHRLNVALSTYRRWETGKTMMRVKQIYNVICNLHVKPNDLFIK